MKASDLMIGDWVAYFGDIESKYPVKIEGVDIATNALITSDREDVGFDGIQPLPITPEILEKNGFIKEQRICNGKPLQYCVLVDGLWIDISGENYFEGKLEYIHELQHALKLCRIEKEIIL